MGGWRGDDAECRESALTAAPRRLGLFCVVAESLDTGITSAVDFNKSADLSLGELDNCVGLEVLHRAERSHGHIRPARDVVAALEGKLVVAANGALKLRRATKV